MLDDRWMHAVKRIVPRNVLVHPIHPAEEDVHSPPVVVVAAVEEECYSNFRIVPAWKRRIVVHLYCQLVCQRNWRKGVYYYRD
jgi:hypothetical protein